MKGKILLIGCVGWLLLVHSAVPIRAEAATAPTAPSAPPVPASTPASVKVAPAVLTVDQAVDLALAHSLKRQIAVNDVAAAGDKVAQAKAGYRGTLSLSGGVSQLNHSPDLVKLGDKLADLSHSLGEAFSTLAGVYSQLATAIIHSGQPAAAAAPYNTLSGAYGQIGQGFSSVEGPDDGLTYYGYSLSYQLPLYTGGKLETLNRQAKTNEDCAKINLDTVEQDLTFEVKKAYYTVLQAQQMQKTLDEAVQSMENHLREAQLFFKAGQVAQLDVIRAEVKLADLKQKQLALNNALDLAQTYFNFVLGVDTDNKYTFVDQVEYTPFAMDLATCQKTALEQRTEIKAINAKISMAKDAVAIVKSTNKPLVALVAQGSDQTTKPLEEEPDLSLSVVASIKLLDGGMVKSQVAEAQKTVDQANTAADLITRGIKLDVEQAYHNLQNALEMIEVSKKVLAQAEETVKMADVSYRAGLSTSLERIDAETGLTQAKSNYNQALSNYQIALAQLQRAIGNRREK